MSKYGFSAAVKADIARAVSDELAPLAKKRGANPRLAFYAKEFGGVGDAIDAGLGRTAAWRKARSAAGRSMEQLDELVDYYVLRLYHGLDDEASLVLNFPDRARLAEECLTVLFPLHTLR